MKYALALIDKAAKVCGSYAELSRKIDLAESTISEIRKGKRRLPPDCVPILADLLGLDVHETIDQIMIENASGTKREAALKEILGKALAAGVAAMLVFFYSADSTFAMGHSQKVTYNQSSITDRFNPVYIVLSILRRWLRRWHGSHYGSPWGLQPHTPAPSA